MSRQDIKARFKKLQAAEKALEEKEDNIPIEKIVRDLNRSGAGNIPDSPKPHGNTKLDMETYKVVMQLIKGEQ